MIDHSTLVGTAPWRKLCSGCSTAKHKWTQNFCNEWKCTSRFGGHSLLVVIFINSEQYKTICWEILPSEYSFVNANMATKFASHSVHRWGSVYKNGNNKFSLSGIAKCHVKFHKVIVTRSFEHVCVVEYKATAYLDHIFSRGVAYCCLLQ
jgi:hypothetical protein